MNRLAEYRAQKGMSQEDLSVKSKVSRPYISEIETGTQKTITNTVMYKLAEALNESVVDIFFSQDVV